MCYTVPGECDCRVVQLCLAGHELDWLVLVQTASLHVVIEGSTDATKCAHRRRHIQLSHGYTATASQARQQSRRETNDRMWQRRAVLNAAYQ